MPPHLILRGLFAELDQKLAISSLGLEMKYLCPLRWQVKIKPVFRDVAADTLVALCAEQISHCPMMLGEFGHVQRHVTLTAMRGQIHDYQIKRQRLQLPLDHHEVL